MARPPGRDPIGPADEKALGREDHGSPQPHEAAVAQGEPCVLDEAREIEEAEQRVLREFREKDTDS